MVGMAYWVVVVPEERHAAERLFLHDALELTGLGGPTPVAGDEVALVVATPEPVVFALGRGLAGADGGDEVPDDPGAGQSPSAALDIAYTRRLFDAPLPADGLPGPGPGAHPLDADAFAALAAKADSHREVKSEWLVGLYLPIEAASAAEA